MSAILLTQNQSASIVKQLKTGNSQSIRTINVDNLIEEMINEVFTLEQASRYFINTGNDTSYREMQSSIMTLDKNKILLKKIGSVNDSNANLINEFISLIDSKTKPIQQLNAPGNKVLRDSIAAGIFSEKGKAISDSIYTTALAIQLKFEKDLEQAIIKNETLSGRVLSLAKILGFISIGAIAILATIIILRLLKHFNLIRTLHHTNEELHTAKQQTERASKVKEQFLSNMSHEIRTPVNSIIGFTRLLQKTPLKGEQEQYVGLIKSAGDNLLNIVNDILDISKIEAGMMHFDKNPFSLKELCYTVEMMFYHPVAEKKLTYESVIDENVPEILTGDKERLNQILTNLVNNAIKFTHKGGITLHVSLKEDTGDGVRVLFTVKDTGIGIKPDKINAIFERFEQEEAETTRNYGGTGLGLSIVKKLATLQGGLVFVRSEVGKGSEFIVELPFGKGEETSFENISFGSYKNICPVNEKNNLSHINILAAEDNKMNQMLLTYIFQQWGANFMFADNGALAVDLLKKNSFDIVLMDIQMPVMDGYTAAGVIRKELKSTIPVIAMTANVLPGEKEKCRANGMDDYIAKPLNEYILYDMILKFIPEIKKDNATPAASKFIDTDYLLKIYKGNQDFIREIINQFQVQYPAELEKLLRAVDVRDFSSVTKMGHNMKTTVSSINNHSPLLEHLEAIENAENSASGWEIIHHKTKCLADSKAILLSETKAFEATLSYQV